MNELKNFSIILLADTYFSKETIQFSVEIKERSLLLEKRPAPKITICFAGKTQKLGTETMNERKNEHKKVKHTVNYRKEEIDMVCHLIGLVDSATKPD